VRADEDVEKRRVDAPARQPRDELAFGQLPVSCRRAICGQLHEMAGCEPFAARGDPADERTTSATSVSGAFPGGPAVNRRS
jgi:hypothetical protein